MDIEQYSGSSGTPPTNWDGIRNLTYEDMPITGRMSQGGPRAPNNEEKQTARLNLHYLIHRIQKYYAMIKNKDTQERPDNTWDRQWGHFRQQVDFFQFHQNVLLRKYMNKIFLLFAHLRTREQDFLNFGNVSNSVRESWMPTLHEMREEIRRLINNELYNYFHIDVQAMDQMHTPRQIPGQQRQISKEEVGSISRGMEQMEIQDKPSSSVKTTPRDWPKILNLTHDELPLTSRKLNGGPRAATLEEKTETRFHLSYLISKIDNYLRLTDMYDRGEQKDSVFNWKKLWKYYRSDANYFQYKNENPILQQYMQQLFVYMDQLCEQNKAAYIHTATPRQRQAWKLILTNMRKEIERLLNNELYNFFHIDVPAEDQLPGYQREIPVQLVEMPDEEDTEFTGSSTTKEWHNITELTDDELPITSRKMNGGPRARTHEEKCTSRFHLHFLLRKIANYTEMIKNFGLGLRQNFDYRTQWRRFCQQMDYFEYHTRSNFKKQMKLLFTYFDQLRKQANGIELFETSTEQQRQAWLLVLTSMHDEIARLLNNELYNYFHIGVLAKDLTREKQRVLTVLEGVTDNQLRQEFAKLGFHNISSEELIEYRGEMLKLMRGKLPNDSMSQEQLQYDHTDRTVTGSTPSSTSLGASTSNDQIYGKKISLKHRMLKPEEMTPRVEKPSYLDDYSRIQAEYMPEPTEDFTGPFDTLRKVYRDERNFVNPQDVTERNISKKRPPEDEYDVYRRRNNPIIDMMKYKGNPENREYYYDQYTFDNSQMLAAHQPPAHKSIDLGGSDDSDSDGEDDIDRRRSAAAWADILSDSDDEEYTAIDSEYRSITATARRNPPPALTRMPHPHLLDVDMSQDRLLGLPDMNKMVKRAAELKAQALHTDNVDLDQILRDPLYFLDNAMICVPPSDGGPRATMMRRQYRGRIAMNCLMARLNLIQQNLRENKLKMNMTKKPEVKPGYFLRPENKPEDEFEDIFYMETDYREFCEATGSTENANIRKYIERLKQIQKETNEETNRDDTTLSMALVAGILYELKYDINTTHYNFIVQPAEDSISGTSFDQQRFFSQSKQYKYLFREMNPKAKKQGGGKKATVFENQGRAKTMVNDLLQRIIWVVEGTSSDISQFTTGFEALKNLVGIILPEERRLFALLIIAMKNLQKTNNAAEEEEFWLYAVAVFYEFKDILHTHFYNYLMTPTEGQDALLKWANIPQTEDFRVIISRLEDLKQQNQRSPNKSSPPAQVVQEPHIPSPSINQQQPRFSPAQSVPRRPPPQVAHSPNVVPQFVPRGPRPYTGSQSHHRSGFTTPDTYQGAYGNQRSGSATPNQYRGAYGYHGSGSNTPNQYRGAYGNQGSGSNTPNQYRGAYGYQGSGSNTPNQYREAYGYQGSGSNTPNQYRGAYGNHGSGSNTPNQYRGSYGSQRAYHSNQGSGSNTPNQSQGPYNQHYSRRR